MYSKSFVCFTEKARVNLERNEYKYIYIYIYRECSGIEKLLEKENRQCRGDRRIRI